MADMNRKSYWKFWWKQVLKGLIPECAYRMAKIRADKAKQIKELEAENEQLKISIECVIEDLKAWHCLADEIGRVNIERFIKDLGKTGKAGK
jgi:hypothetical protein